MATSGHCKIHARLLPAVAVEAAVRGPGACRLGRRCIWVLDGSGGCMYEGQRTGPAARRICHGLGAGGGLDWRWGLEGLSRGTWSRGQLKFLKDNIVCENSSRSCRRVADPDALEVWGGEWVPPFRAVANSNTISRLSLQAVNSNPQQWVVGDHERPLSRGSFTIKLYQ